MSCVFVASQDILHDDITCVVIRPTLYIITVSVRGSTKYAPAAQVDGEKWRGFPCSAVAQMVREMVVVQVGQCGNQVGQELWRTGELYLF